MLKWIITVLGKLTILALRTGRHSRSLDNSGEVNRKEEVVENSSWWVAHLGIIIIQIAAFVAYFVGSRRFYRREEKCLDLIGLGIIFDVIVVLAVVAGLPRLEENQGAPHHSILFLLHVWTASLGMLGFIILFFYLLFNGVTRKYRRLRVFQYRILLPLWCLGVIIALVNFISEATVGIRIYDHF